MGLERKKGERSGLGAYLSPMECGDNLEDYLITFWVLPLAWRMM